jgi:hypothetical protein
MMDAVEFLDKVDRLSKRGSPEEKMRYNAYRVAGDNTGAVEYVEQLDDMHPIKTRQSEFLKLFPYARVKKANGLPIVSPCDLDVKLAGKCGEIPCQECWKKFWLAEVEDV